MTGKEKCEVLRDIRRKIAGLTAAIADIVFEHYDDWDEYARR